MTASAPGVLPSVTPNEAVARTNSHYELPPEVFAAFLGTSMKYSCGLYSGPESTLDQAQEAKLAWVVDANLRLRPGQRLLDVGCGWGSLVLFAARRGIEVVGVTPSRPQREHILRRAAELGVADLVEVRLGGFTESDLSGRRFDGVAMIGSIVHMPDRAEVLLRAYELLGPKGRLYLSESCFRNRKIFDAYRRSPGFEFVGGEIFGFGEMVPLSDLIAAAEEAGFSIVKLTDLTTHYPRTLADWEERVRDRRNQIDALIPGTADRLLRYFKIGSVGFGFTTKHYAFAAEKSRMGRLEGVE
ncbi:class I SAM-dependent methyltransferase [Streptomyces sp. NPDC002588]|uniref:SAM-dependent methyltransferase n=1 Tax=Streptomyces sp. NPDC002588 TaxID=3154419 RepID=UPI003320D8B1